ncbi:unnamed protein product [Blumeria hordei]|uniref:Uncharacterized protein n=1 Tax=Blumeria hordei TaxID=2867405 RepID=A0A383V237_BLUHO|nr:unnamed protein product [Blumeria hordei]
MAVCDNDSRRPVSTYLVDTPAGPYLYGTGAPLKFFTSDTVDSPAIISNNLRAMVKRDWPASLEDLPAPIEYDDTEAMAEKLAAFFVNQSDPDDVSEIPPPISPHELFMGFNAVHIYQYGIDFCYQVMCHISRLGERSQTPEVEEQETYPLDWVRMNIGHLIQLPRIEDEDDEFEAQTKLCGKLREISPAKARTSRQRMEYYRKLLLDNTKSPSSEIQLFEDVVQPFSDSEDDDALYDEQSGDDESDEVSQQSDYDETSLFGYTTDQTSSPDLMMPYLGNFRSKIPVMISRKSPICATDTSRERLSSSNVDVGRCDIRALPSKIPQPIKLFSTSKKRKSLRILFNG